MGWDRVFLWMNSVVVDGKGVEGLHWAGCCSAIEHMEGLFLTTPRVNRQSSAESSKDAHGLALFDSLNSKSAKMHELAERKFAWLRDTYFIVVVPECIYSIFLYFCGRPAWDSRWARLVCGFNSLNRTWDNESNKGRHPKYWPPGRMRLTQLTSGLFSLDKHVHRVPKCERARRSERRPDQHKLVYRECPGIRHHTVESIWTERRQGGQSSFEVWCKQIWKKRRFRWRVPPRNHLKETRHTGRGKGRGNSLERELESPAHLTPPHLLFCEVIDCSTIQIYVKVRISNQLRLGWIVSRMRNVSLVQCKQVQSLGKLVVQT